MKIKVCNLTIELKKHSVTNNLTFDKNLLYLLIQTVYFLSLTLLFT